MLLATRDCLVGVFSAFIVGQQYQAMRSKMLPLFGPPCHRPVLNSILHCHAIIHKRMSHGSDMVFSSSKAEAQTDFASDWLSEPINFQSPAWYGRRHTLLYLMMH